MSSKDLEILKVQSIIGGIYLNLKKPDRALVIFKKSLDLI
jgi:hypothetical protein